MKFFRRNNHSIGVVLLLFVEIVASNTPASDTMLGFMCLFKTQQLMT